jgi:hypothetical protein
MIEQPPEDAFDPYDWVDDYPDPPEWWDLDAYGDDPQEFVL